MNKFALLINLRKKATIKITFKNNFYHFIFFYYLSHGMYCIFIKILKKNIFKILQQPVSWHCFIMRFWQKNLKFWIRREKLSFVKYSSLLQMMSLLIQLNNGETCLLYSYSQAIYRSKWDVFLLFIYHDENCSTPLIISISELGT